MSEQLPGLPPPLWNHFWCWKSSWSPRGFCLWSCWPLSCRWHLTGLWCPNSWRPEKREATMTWRGAVRKRPDWRLSISKNISTLTAVLTASRGRFVLGSFRELQHMNSSEFYCCSTRFHSDGSGRPGNRHSHSKTTGCYIEVGVTFSGTSVTHGPTVPLPSLTWKKPCVYIYYLHIEIQSQFRPSWDKEDAD